MVGRFITIEGGEGVGKSVMIAGLREELAGRGFEVVATREPGGTPTADLIRGLFARPASGDPLTSRAEALLVSAARAQHVERVIRPALARGAWVISDRFADSTRVYQGVMGQIDASSLEQLIAFSTGSLSPDLTFLLDCDPGIALDRMHRRQQTGTVDAIARFDEAGLAFHERLRRAYRDVAGRFPGRVVLLDAAQDPATIRRLAMAALGSRFELA